jgi:hypothetical protein
MSDQLPDDTTNTADAAFVERVMPALREPVSLAPDFDARVMNAVRAEAQRSALHGTKARSWWSRPRTYTMSPLGTLAAAAGFAAIVALGTFLATRKTIGDAMTAGAPAGAGDTVHVVRFLYVDRNASAVTVVGDFNGWNGEATPRMRTAVEGVWSVTLPMRTGRHEYAFVADGKRWTLDPLAQAVADEHGTESSVVNVGLETR